MMYPQPAGSVGPQLDTDTTFSHTLPKSTKIMQNLLFNHALSAATTPAINSYNMGPVF